MDTRPARPCHTTEPGATMSEHRVRSSRHVHVVRPDTGQLACGRLADCTDAGAHPVTCKLCQRNLTAWARPTGYQDLFGKWWVGPPWDRQRKSPRRASPPSDTCPAVDTDPAGPVCRPAMPYAEPKEQP